MRLVLDDVFEVPIGNSQHADHALVADGIRQNRFHYGAKFGIRQPTKLFGRQRPVGRLPFGDLSHPLTLTVLLRTIKNHPAISIAQLDSVSDRTGPKIGGLISIRFLTVP